MARRIISFFAVIVLIAGLSLLLYPTVSNYFETVKHRRAIFNYLATVETISDEDYSEILSAAEAYNARLADNPLPVMKLTKEQYEEYESLLDITGTGIMGYITVSSAGIYLPIYHGTGEAVLQVGVGHLEGSSLPIGGDSVHSLLSGHRGLPSAMLFTNLDKLQIGDRFTLHVLGEIYTYEVDSIDTVLPDELQYLTIEKGHDYCTLITCTPYGVNTHRMLVRGKRIMVPIEEERMSIQSGARIIDTWQVIAVVEVPVLIISVFFSTRYYRKRESKRPEREKTTKNVMS